jgi:hypothetical protein
MKWFGKVTLIAATSVRADMTLFKFDAASTGAMCTDGTPAGFYFEAAASGDTARWVIELEGGGICESNADCAQRENSDLGSSKNWVSSITDGGQLSTNRTVNPDFHDYNHVFVPYCSGDCWTGMQQKAVNPWSGPGKTFVFTGNSIMQAVVDKVIDYVGGASKVKELLLEGCSAGGIGTFQVVVRAT